MRDFESRDVQCLPARKSWASGPPAKGEVVLVGAGPGHPECITLAGYRALLRAEVVVHDRLIHPDLIAEVPRGVERIDVGKRPGGLGENQENIHRLLVERAQRGLRVVRLKGGDPFVFGRGGEEVLALEAAGIAWRVIPGLSSAFSAPAIAGIPVTHRNVARSVAVVTARAEGEGPDWQALARMDTIVVLMGVAVLERIGTSLVHYGRSPQTPVALIERASLPGQQVLRTELGKLVQDARQSRISAPATLVVGEVTRLLPDVHRRLRGTSLPLERAS